MKSGEAEVMVGKENVGMVGDSPDYEGWHQVPTSRSWICRDLPAFHDAPDRRNLVMMGSVHVIDRTLKLVNEQS